MSRRYWILWLVSGASSAAFAQSKPPEQEQAPPEEDENLAAPEYTFNPLQAEKELKIGAFYFKKGNFRAAAIRFEEALKWDPNSAEAYLRLAQTREKQKDPKAARTAYAKYLDLAPDAKNADEVRRKIQESSGKKRD